MECTQDMAVFVITMELFTRVTFCGDTSTELKFIEQPKEESCKVNTSEVTRVIEKRGRQHL
jgi:hypothetical protein